jgi:GntR family transcriptional regulator
MNPYEFEGTPLAQHLSGTDKFPLYVQIKEAILEDIRSGLFQSGDPIPTEIELCKKFSASRNTVRQAITGLVYEGYLVKQQGRGTFVSRPKIETNLSQVYSFAQDMTDRGLNPESNIIDFEVVLPKASVREKLHLSKEQLVYKIVRLRLVNGEPILFEHSFLPEYLFTGLTQHDLQRHGSLYGTLSERFQARLEHVIDFFEPVLIDDYHSKLLEVAKGSPALFVERIGFIKNNIPAELSQSVIRGDRCRYFVNLFRGMNE